MSSHWLALPCPDQWQFVNEEMDRTNWCSMQEATDWTGTLTCAPGSGEKPSNIVGWEEEKCGVMLPLFGTKWFAAPCSLALPCLCQHGGSPSDDYKATVPSLKVHQFQITGVLAQVPHLR